jgi:hypothetical protein
MGSPLGVFHDDEVKGLSEDELRQLRENVINQLPPDVIRELIKPYLQKNPDVRNKLRDELGKKYSKIKKDDKYNRL